MPISFANNEYINQFNNYYRWFERSMDLVQVVRSYARSSFSWQESDLAAASLLVKIKNKSLSYEDLLGFITGPGGWTDTSTKTLFFALVNPLTMTAENTAALASEFINSLREKGVDLINNPNEILFAEGNFFEREIRALSNRQLAINVELDFLEHYLKKEEYACEAVVKCLRDEKLDIHVHLDLLNTFHTLAHEELCRQTEVPTDLQAQWLELKLGQLEVQYKLALAGTVDDEESIAPLREQLSTFSQQLEILENRIAGRDASRLHGDLEAAASIATNPHAMFSPTAPLAENFIADEEDPQPVAIITAQ